MYDILIIGAGPAGCRTAELLARAGRSVLVIEAREKVGEPVQCTGLISSRIKEIHPNLPKNVVQNKIKTARFFAPDGQSFSLSPRKPALVVNRKEFDNWLYRRAKKAGAKFKLGTRFEVFNIKRDRISVKTSGKNYECKFLVGADGPNSKVRSQAGLEGENYQKIFSQKTIKGKFGDRAELHFEGCYFNWLVPLSKTRARIGGPTQEMDFKGNSGGVCRYGLLNSARKGRIYLVGDSALQVKPFSCGGIVYGQIGAEYLARAILEGEEYNVLWRKKLANSIRRGLLLCWFYKLPNSLKNILFWILIKTRAYRLLENLDMDFY